MDEQEHLDLEDALEHENQDLTNEVNELYDRIRELEEENAELRDYIYRLEREQND